MFGAYRKMMQMQMVRLNATNNLITAIRINHLIAASEADAGLIANSVEEADLEDDDG